MIKIQLENINGEKEIVEFENKSDFKKAMFKYRKEGYILLTKGWYYNKVTKGHLYTSIYYCI